MDVVNFDEDTFLSGKGKEGEGKGGIGLDRAWKGEEMGWETRGMYMKGSCVHKAPCETARKRGSKKTKVMDKKKRFGFAPTKALVHSKLFFALPLDPLGAKQQVDERNWEHDVIILSRKTFI